MSAHEKRNIIFSFADKGIGIPKNELSNIFGKFYRIKRTNIIKMEALVWVWYFVRNWLILWTGK